MRAAYGIPVCPDDGGALLAHPDWGERLHCPNAHHGGNGRFFAPSEAATGEPPVYRRPRPTAPEPRGDAPAADTATDPSADVPAKENTFRALPVSAARGPKPCKCGCGGTTKGGTFLPGHDARYHAALKRVAAQRIKEVLG